MDRVQLGSPWGLAGPGVSEPDDLAVHHGDRHLVRVALPLVALGPPLAEALLGPRLQHLRVEEVRISGNPGALVHGAHRIKVNFLGRTEGQAHRSTVAGRRAGTGTRMRSSAITISPGNS